MYALGSCIGAFNYTFVRPLQGQSDGCRNTVTRGLAAAFVPYLSVYRCLCYHASDSYFCFTPCIVGGYRDTKDVTRTCTGSRFRRRNNIIVIVQI